MSGPRILTFSSLFPNSEQRHHGLFVAERLHHLLTSSAIETRVIAPVPWFPFRHPLFGGYSQKARIPLQENRAGITVYHPRYPLLPKVGMTLAPLLMARAMENHLQRLIQEGWDFDLIDAHYFYPDGVAAMMLGKKFQKPVVITGRGTDLNLIPKHPLPRQMIQWAAREAAACITVCQALKERLMGLGIGEERVTVLRNGVDLTRFTLPPRGAVATIYKKPGRTTLLSVGHLIPRKGHDLILRALVDLPQADLIIIGQGGEKQKLRALAEVLGIRDRVSFPGAVSHSELKHYYRAADALVLASDREGWANVLLEAMACGTPVIATPVWGTPEVVNTPAAGVLMHERSPQALVAAYQKLFAAYPDPQATRRHAEGFSWQATSRGQLDLFERVLQKG
ncbi:MAG: glycosyltransferase family 4 protein [Magnetococcales bacterium]|nr:glycosyltransferase family 4 protein [Magnetococcales bacterium]